MRTVCIYHRIDLDGWMSAAIVKHWWIQNHIQYFEEGGILKVHNPQIESLEFIGWNHYDAIPDLSEYDKVIMCDISFPFKETSELVKRLGYNFIWIDHHISAIKENECIMWTNKIFTVPIKMRGLRDTKFAACELTWKFFFPDKPMPEIVRLLGRYDCFGHKFTKEDQDKLDTLYVEYNTESDPLHTHLDEMNKLFNKKNEEEKIMEFQYGARKAIFDVDSAYQNLKINLVDNEIIDLLWDDGAAIYQYLCTEARQTYKNGFEINFSEKIPHSFIEDTFVERKFICINKERFNPINFGIDYHKEGYDGAACFHYDGLAKLWSFSLYNDNGEVDCSAIAKKFGGGGHKGAAGFSIINIEEMFN